MGAGGRFRSRGRVGGRGRIKVTVVSTNYEHPKRAAIANCASVILIFIGGAMIMVGIMFNVVTIYEGVPVIGPIFAALGGVFILTSALLCVFIVKPSCCFPGRVKNTAVTPGVPIISGSSVQNGQQPSTLGQYGTQPAQYGTQPAQYSNPVHVGVHEQYPAPLGAPPARYGQYPAAVGAPPPGAPPPNDRPTGLYNDPAYPPRN